LERFPNPLPDKSDIFWLYASSSFVLTKRSLYKKTADEFQVIADMRELDKAIMTSAVAWGKSVAIATYMKGVALVDLDTGSTKFVTRAAGLPTLGATTVFADSTNRLWVGTDKGIAVLESPRFGHTIPVKENPVSAIRAGGLLIGYEDRAEYFHEGREDEKLSHVFSLTPTSHGLAVGLFGSVRVGSREFKTPGNQVGSVVDLLNGRLLATTGEILYQLDFASGQAEVVPGIPEKISQLHSFSGHVWMSSASGKIYRAEARAPFTFTKVADLPDGDTDAAISNLGSVLVVAGRESVRFGEKLSVVANTLGVRNPRLAKTKSDLWLVADQDGEHRLGKLVPSGDAVSWETVEAKGLAALPDVHYFSASDDALMFCGGNTILELYAAELKPAYRLAAPLLEFTLADAKSGAITTLPSPPEKLSSEKNSLTFSGTLPYDEFGEKPAYERRLLPTETVWIPTKAGEKVSYPSLSPRHYTLEVRATHLGHQGTTTALAFTVLPPWFASPEAFAGYVALALVSGYSLFRLRTRQIRLRNLQLETIVQERTSELAKASAAKTEFLASMSHEIRNPMNGVIGLVNILREETPTPRQAHTLKLLHGCAEQLRSTVDDILDFSKIEAGHVVLERSTFDLLDTLEASAATVDPTRRKITFVDRPPAGLSLRGDAGKLRQIFANYLSNALKYGIPPEARVSTILVPTDDSVRLTLSVTSSGPTIAKDTLDGFFESFARGADAMERNIHGTGLGLAICKRYAQAMGGEVGAVSTNGETTFYLNIPFAKANEAAPLPAVVAAPVSALPAKALAIEDEDYNRIVLGSILTKMNYTVDWATTGAEALQLARENGYDIVLTDYRLPDTNGVDLAREILQLCPEPKPAVFAVTAYSTKERRDECLNAGMAGFISKPITLEKLRATLAAWGDKQLTTISLESTRRPLPKQPPAAIESGWIELKRAALIDTVRAAELAHRLNNVCRAFNYLDLAEQLELLEGALERGEPAAPFLQACERLLRPSEGDQLS
jgi:signal transduction histidine kinase/CheY-like chemotaxis protein